MVHGGACIWLALITQTAVAQDNLAQTVRSPQAIQGCGGVPLLRIASPIIVSDALLLAACLRLGSLSRGPAVNAQVANAHWTLFPHALS